MRRVWLLLVLVACARPPREVAIGTRHPIVLTAIAAPVLRLVDLPTLPPRHGFDEPAAASCRAQLRHAERVLYRDPYVSTEQLFAELGRLAYLAVAAGGDCRIDADELIGSVAPWRIGGCGGPRTEEALALWALVADVATTRARRVAALHNAAALVWNRVDNHGAYRIEDWFVAGDALLRAAHADPDREELWAAAVSAFEHPLVRPDRAYGPRLTAHDVARIARALAQIHDGRAGDRARAIRARLRY